MSQLYEKPLPVGKVGNYTYTVNPRWLGREKITEVTATCDGATVTLPTYKGNILQAYFEGVSTGKHEVHWSWKTATRSDCTGGRYRVYIDVVDC